MVIKKNTITKPKGGRIESGRWGGWHRGKWWQEMETIVLEQQ